MVLNPTSKQVHMHNGSPDCVEFARLNHHNYGTLQYGCKLWPFRKSRYAWIYSFIVQVYESCQCKCWKLKASLKFVKTRDFTEGYYKAALRRWMLLMQHALWATPCSLWHGIIQSVVCRQALTLKLLVALLYVIFLNLIICFEGIESL